MPSSVPLSPQWWLARLSDQLDEQVRLNEIYRNYYLGVHPAPWLTEEALDEFRRLLSLTKSNYLGLVVDAQVERQEVVGFRISSDFRSGSSDAEDDDVMWRIWKANDLDAHFDGALLEAAITGRDYVMLEPPEAGSRLPRVHVEHPDQVVVEYVPGTNRRVPAAALKRWIDDWTGRTHATLYYRDHRGGPSMQVWVFKFSSRTANGPMDWVRREVRGESWPARFALRRIPIWELPNNPMALTGGRSEIDDLIPIQDRLNKGLADRLIAQDFGAFPQKYVSGWPEVDASGQANAKIRIGQDRLLATDVTDARFGAFPATDLGGYIETKMADVKDLASRSRTPAQYLLGEVANVAGDTLRMAESGLAAKVRQRNRPHSVELSSLAREARILAGEPALPEGAIIDTQWRNPEFRSEGELVDALVKMHTLEVPNEALWERWGATPAEIARWRVMREEEQRRLAALDPLATLAGRYPDQQQQEEDELPPDSPATGARQGARTKTRTP